MAGHNIPDKEEIYNRVIQALFQAGIYLQEDTKSEEFKEFVYESLIIWLEYRDHLTFDLVETRKGELRLDTRESCSFTTEMLNDFLQDYVQEVTQELEDDPNPHQAIWDENSRQFPNQDVDINLETEY